MRRPSPRMYAPTSSPVVDRIVTRLDEHADRWHALPVGGSLELTW